MANLNLALSLSLSLFFFTIITLVPLPSSAVSSCNDPCRTLDDCQGQLICIHSKCNDDPDVRTHICSRGEGTSPLSTTLSDEQGDCQPSSSLTCGDSSYPTYTCSPPVTSPTAAKLTNNDFSRGGDGGGESECDDSYHNNTESIVALSTGWFNRGSMCGKMISITASNGNSVTAMVVDECDSTRGCDKEHDYQRPCENNIVDGSDAVWTDLGLNTDDGKVDVTWSMAQH